MEVVEKRCSPFVQNIGGGRQVSHVHRSSRAPDRGEARRDEFLGGDGRRFHRTAE